MVGASRRASEGEEMVVVFIRGMTHSTQAKSLSVFARWVMVMMIASGDDRHCNIRDPWCGLLDVPYL